MPPTEATRSTEGAEASAIAWVSGSRVVHLSLDCPGLDRMRSFDKDPEQLFDRETYRALDDLVDLRIEGDPTSLCRLCAVEAVAVDILERRRLEGHDRGVFATFKLSRPVEQGRENARANVRARSRAKARYPADDARDQALAAEAAGRLKRIAAAAGLRTTRSRSSLVAYGFLSRSAVEELARVLHVEPKFTVTQMPDAELVSTFWTMRAAAEHGTTAHHPDTGSPHDPWYLAELICQAPPEDRDRVRDGSYK